jgi:hypothetical protein
VRRAEFKRAAMGLPLSCHSDLKLCYESKYSQNQQLSGPSEAQNSKLRYGHLSYYHKGCFNIIIIIIGLLMSPLLGHRPSLWITHNEKGCLFYTIANLP